MDFEVEPYALKLVEGTNGEGLDREATATALTQSALSTNGRSVEVVLKSVPPDLTTEEVQAMGIKDLLGDYKTSPYVGTKDRQKNVRLATKLCSGVFLAPGEVFNTDERLGIRDAAHGWALAPGITGPGKLEDVFGGGICQVSTTLFNAALLAGLEITKRYNHSIFINHYPDGRDATVTAGGKNMCFRNDTDHYIFIYGWSTGINTRFWIYGVADGRKVLPIRFSGFSIVSDYPTQTIINKSLPPGTVKEIFEGQKGRRCFIERTVVYADGTQKTVKFSSYYPMMPKVVETNPKAATTTTGGSGTTDTTEAPTTTILGP
jgi:vancomycin resistance protein YoaR